MAARRQLNDHKGVHPKHSGGSNPYGDDNTEDQAYVDDDDYGNEAPAKDAKGGNGGKDGAEDLINYKGIYFNDDQGQKYTDPDNGAHFEFNDLCKRLNRIL